MRNRARPCPAPRPLELARTHLGIASSSPHVMRWHHIDRAVQRALSSPQYDTRPSRGGLRCSTVPTTPDRPHRSHPGFTAEQRAAPGRRILLPPSDPPPRRRPASSPGRHDGSSSENNRSAPDSSDFSPHCSFPRELTEPRRSHTKRVHRQSRTGGRRPCNHRLHDPSSLTRPSNRSRTPPTAPWLPRSPSFISDAERRKPLPATPTTTQARRIRTCSARPTPIPEHISFRIPQRQTCR